jgi:hypothetical protein
MEHTQYKRPIWLGFLIAPLAAPLAFIVVLAAYDAASGGIEDIIRFLKGTVIFFIIGVPISYGAMLVLGLPYVLWLKRLGRFTSNYICLGAIVSGAITFTAYWAGGRNLPQPLVYYSLLGSLLGLVSGLVFVATVGPNKSFKSGTPKSGAP